MKRLLATLLFLVPNAAWATCSSVPYTFTPNTLAQSGQVNANFAAVVSCTNNIDTSQITTGVLGTARGGTNNGSWTAGSVVFATATTQLGQDNANLFFDSTNKRLLIGDNSAVGSTTPVIQAVLTGSNTSAIAAAFSSSQISFALNPASGGAWTMYDGQGGTFTASITSKSGNVGIGTTSPTHLLDVNGTANATQYDVAGSQISAANLSNGTTGSGAIMLAASPTTTGTLTAAAISASGAISTSSTISATGNITSSGGNIAAAGNLQVGVSQVIGFNNHTDTTATRIGGTDSDMNLQLGSGNDKFIFFNNGGTVVATIDHSGNVSAGLALQCTGTGSKCINDLTTGDSLSNQSAGVWFFSASGGGNAQLLSGQYSSGAPSTSGSSTACLVNNVYFSGYAGLTVCASDGRLKDIGAPIDNALSLVSQLKPVNFTWKDGVDGHPIADKDKHVGFIAQDVLKLMPECVNTNPDKYYGLDTNCVVAYVAKAVQEMNAKLTAHGIN